MAPREMPTYFQPTVAKQVVTLKGVFIWDGKEGLLHFHKYQRELNEWILQNTSVFADHEAQVFLVTTSKHVVT